jgi:hypothetical protein
MKSTFKKISLYLPFLLIGSAAQAQYDQEIISVGDRKLTVENAFKIDELPATLDSVPKPLNIKYTIIPRQMNVTYSPKKIKAANLKLQDPLTKLYRGYAKAGIGLYVTPLLDFRYNSVRNRDWDYGIKANHFSSQGGVPKLAESAFSENYLGGYAKKYIEKHTVEAGLGYDRDAVHYYGFELGDSKLKKDKYKQTFNTILGHAEVMSHYSDSTKIEHRVRIDYRNMSDAFKSREGNFLLSADGAKTIEDYRFGLLFQVDANNLKIAQINTLFADTSFTVPEIVDVTTKGGIIRIEPTIHAKKNDLTADVGLAFAIETGEPESAFHIYPKAYVSYSLFDDLFTPYAGVNGQLERNSYNSLRTENPFITHFTALKNTSTDYNLYGGIRGTIMDNIGFNAKFSYISYTDRPLFVNDVFFSAENRFNVVYEDMTETRIMGELTYVHDKRLTVIARLDLMKYKTKSQARPWNLPSAEITLDARYDLDDRFVVKLQLFTQGKRFASGTQRTGVLSPETDLSEVEPIQLRAFVDGSIGVEYRYTKRISAFIELNNLSGGRYQRFYRYPVQSVMVLGGLTYSF